MANKVLTNITLFIAGNASQAVPSRASMTYDVVAGKAQKKGIYNIPDVDAEKTPKKLWTESIEQIKEIEGIS